ncbi:MAG: hypothetical protein ACR2FN_06965 [Chitinophagaceae bacterium]
MISSDGYKFFGDSGIVISNKKSGTAIFVFNACTGEYDDLFVGFQYLKNGAYESTIQKISAGGTFPWGKKGIDLGAGLAPYPAVLSTGDIAVAWNNNGVINYQKLSPDGTKAWSSPKEIHSSTGHSVTRAQVVAHTKGTFGIVYQDLFAAPIYTHLFMLRFNNNGNAKWDNAQKISTLTTSAARYYDVHADNDNIYVAYYGNPQGTNRFNAYVQKVNADSSLPFGVNGASFADYFGANDPYEKTINIVFSLNESNNFSAVCTFTNSLQTESGIYMQTFSKITGERLLGTQAKELFPITNQMINLTGSGLKLCFGGGASAIFTFTDANNKLYASGVDENGNFMWQNQYTTLCATTNPKSRFGFTNFFNLESPSGGIAVWQEDKGNGDNLTHKMLHATGIWAHYR